MTSSRLILPVTFVLFFAIGLLGCVKQLAPKYDAALFTGVTEVNVRIMSLFASVSAGTDSSTCEERVPLYNGIIGKVEALAMQSKARPVPENSVTDKVNAYLDSRGIGAVNDGVAPSADSLSEVSKQLSKMKQTDCKTGLKPIVVELFKNNVITSMDQAITYESFLQR